ncbi:GntR family transcriptional regulator [Sphingomonas sp. OTU376]|uniref:GntR family transcriptional regulator n=1 Tax=Sphingomonas sp. OTU376 TaxID=3043863 RepID=UPI00313D9DB7
MALDPSTQERVYQALKNEYLAGNFQPGLRMDIQGIADRYRASATPVREALHRLVGEELFEAHPEGGIRLKLPDAKGLAERYAWNAQHLLGALRVASAPTLRLRLRSFRAGMQVSGLRHVDRTAAIFRAIGDATSNAEFVAQIEQANERFHYIRLAELRAISDQERELNTFLRNGAVDVRSNLRRRIIAYHRRRIEHVEEIILVLPSISAS